MNLVDFLDLEAIRFDLAAGSKRGLLNTLSQIAGQRLGIDGAAIAETVAERERLGSTGFGGGVAIPHGKLDGIDRVYGLVARLAQPIDYKAIDGEKVDLVFLLLSPRDAGAEHLKALASISRLVRDAGTLGKLRGARSRDALAAVLIGDDEREVA
ncbi:PTS sugar transporter subunit IIA [Sphingomonas sp. ASV193]|uniref:PTS sugar transporter subunit IIA n=1 Tax=Sphingomonas sp. ASV193 TaxID=3144405 RepID=UPI0032E8D95E